MRHWERVDQAPVPGTESVMDLLRRGEEYVIRVDGRELMSNRVHGSEDALAELACARVGGRPNARMLVGGLGMGFTLAAALRGLGPDAEVTVAELVPAVVTWNQGEAGLAAGHPQADPRTRVFDGDVAALVRKPPAPWDAILLDVDNGPTALTRASNHWLYQASGLEAAYAALSPGGVLAVWSAAPDAGFTRRVARAGFDVEPVQVRSRGKKGGSAHVVWVAVRKAEPPRWRQG